MIEFDSNGIALDAAGNRIYKRYAEIILDGKQVMSGVYIGQSTDTELLVEPFRLATVNIADGSATSLWEYTNTVIAVRKPNIVHVFEPTDEPFNSIVFDEFDPAFDDVDSLARFILNPENIAPMYTVLRETIESAAARTLQGDSYDWTPTIIGIVRAMPKAAPLFAGSLDAHTQMCIARKVLDRAAAIVRGAAS